MSSTLILIILCAISAGVLALAVFTPLHRLGSVLTLLWLAASLPTLYFCALNDKHVLVFYLISAAIALGFCMGGKQK